jgi:acyl-CoA synthetase (AMP-forming)/AMP-acid ligase II
MALNIADLFEHAVDAAPDKPAVKVGARTVTYAELEYLFDNADLVGLVHDRVYAPLVAEVTPKVAPMKAIIAVPNPLEPDDASDLAPFGGVTLEEAVAGQSDARDFGERSPDDIHIIYTGGTTGFPKGVMWRHEDFWRVLGGGIDFYTGALLDEYDQSKQANDPRMITFPLSPLMHGGAQAGLLMHLFAGHLTILEPKFDPVRTWEIIDREKVQLIFMTGDAMARPLIEAYEAGGFDGSSLFAISSSAAIFSPPVKKRWMDAFPNAVFTDSIGASETGFQGMGMQEKGNISTDGPVVGLGPASVVIDDEGNVLDTSKDVGKIGRLGRGGHVPVGYYKDPEKSAATFLVIDGKRYSVPGDFARIEEGNKVTLLGRGSNCVNTGGEKVYPEEVEMAIKGHPAVYDVLVVGVPDEKYGQAVAAVVELREGATLELDELKTFLRAHLSGYKLPRTLTVVDEIPRNATGKAQYPRAKELVLASFAAKHPTTVV